MESWQIKNRPLMPIASQMATKLTTGGTAGAAWAASSRFIYEDEFKEASGLTGEVYYQVPLVAVWK